MWLQLRAGLPCNWTGNGLPCNWSGGGCSLIQLTCNATSGSWCRQGQSRLNSSYKSMDGWQLGFRHHPAGAAGCPYHQSCCTAPLLMKSCWLAVFRPATTSARDSFCSVYCAQCHCRTGPCGHGSRTCLLCLHGDHGGSASAGQAGPCSCNSWLTFQSWHQSLTVFLAGPDLWLLACRPATAAPADASPQRSSESVSDDEVRHDPCPVTPPASAFLLLHCNMRGSNRVPPSGCAAQGLLVVWPCMCCAWWQWCGLSFLALRKRF